MYKSFCRVNPLCMASSKRNIYLCIKYKFFVIKMSIYAQQIKRKYTVIVLRCIVYYCFCYFPKNCPMISEHWKTALLQY